MIIPNRQKRIDALTKTIEDYKKLKVSPLVIIRLEEELKFLKGCKRLSVVRVKNPNYKK